MVRYDCRKTFFKQSKVKKVAIVQRNVGRKIENWEKVLRADESKLEVVNDAFMSILTV